MTTQTTTKPKRNVLLRDTVPGTTSRGGLGLLVSIALGLVVKNNDIELDPEDLLAIGATLATGVSAAVRYIGSWLPVPSRAQAE